MAKLTKKFRFATEGATCDGRTISAQDIKDMAETYKRETYSARVNVEHIRGISPEPPFCAYGDVADGLTVETIDLSVGGKTEKRLALVGQVEALDNLVTMNAKGQKLYPSIEINPNFASSGRAYLQGLAFTDSPASLGTEIMQFAAGAGDANPFASRKTAPGNFFSAVDDGVTLEFVETQQTPGVVSDEAKGFFTAAADFFKSLKPGAVDAATATTTDSQQAANDNDKRFATLVSGMEKMASGITALTTSIDQRFAAVDGKVAGLTTSIESTDASTQHRSKSTGGDGTKKFAATDC